MYLFNLKSIFWNFLKLLSNYDLITTYIIIIVFAKKKKKKKRKIAFYFLVIFFPISYGECPVSMTRWILWKRVHRWRRDALNRLHSRRFLVSRTFSFLTSPRFNSRLVSSWSFSLCCAMPRTYDLDMTILWSRSGNSSIHRWTIDENKDDNARCTRFLVTARYLCARCRFHLCTFTFVFHSFFFFFYFFLRLEFLCVENYNNWNVFFRIIIWLLISVGFTLLYD